ncbi:MULTISPECIES: site-specific DNA-methyltransferase [unclassified Fibrobacter]|uniref:site-specific DNA-methyltransferase n=1 Tax=unclassified Fibrobacter TaxID=2634177 RepID=UPI0025BB4814|nr:MULTISPECIES: site-specific DNA-methyltransferase [unclassified Fibrobacter]
MKNTLIKGDNIDSLVYIRDKMKLRESIDLVYIDPPFATGGEFKTDSNGRVATISSSSSGKIAYSDKLTGSAFIEFLRERVQIIYDLLSSQGSFYLHIDYKIGHYVKCMLDEIFGIENFRNDITRIKCNPKNFSRIGYGNIKDMILFYTKGKNPIWHEPRIPMSEEEIAKLYTKVDKNGRRYTTVPIHAPGETKDGKSSQKFKGILPPPGRHWRCSVEELEQLDKDGLIEWSASGNPRKINYADEHLTKKLQDIWTFKDSPNPIYPTEKNHEMLQTIIKASSNEDSIVMDCFAGSGGTLVEASRLGRKWIGVDKSDIAIETIKKNLENNGFFANESMYKYIEI